MIQEWLKLALKMGFTGAATVDPKCLMPRPEVRAWCAEDKCRCYNTSWACPPGCGTLEACAALLHRYDRGILLETNVFRDSPEDQELLQAGYTAHQRRFRDFADCFSRENPNTLLLGVGACRVCAVCAYPAAPCRHPEARISSLEAFGILVEEVCRDCGLPYYTGGKDLSFIACCLFKMGED